MQRRHFVFVSMAMVASSRVSAQSTQATQVTQSIEILTLRYRRAEDVLPLVQPFIEPGGAITGQGNQLFIRSSVQNRRQIEQMLTQLDRAPRQLLISVRQDRADDRSERELGAQGGVTYSTRSVTGRGTLNANDQHTRGTRNLEHSVRVLEGGRATLTMGVAVPFTFRRWVPQGDGGWVDAQQTVFYEALSGFQVRPTLMGESVTLEITPEESSFNRQGAERMRVATEVQTRLGEWTPLGGADLRSEQNSRGVLGAGSSAQATQRGVWVKVDVVN